MFYPADWLADTRPLSLAAKGALVDLLCTMWWSSDRGVITLSTSGYGRLFGASEDETRGVLAELRDLRICDQTDAGNGDVTLICRRMVREERARTGTRMRVANHRRTASGKALEGSHSVETDLLTERDEQIATPKTEQRNGDVTPAYSIAGSLADSDSPSPASGRVTQMPTMVEVVEFCVSIDLLTDDGESMFHRWVGNGFTVNGHPIKNWRATIRSWKKQGYMPSQKHETTTHRRHSTQVAEGRNRGTLNEGRHLQYAGVGRTGS